MIIEKIIYKNKNYFESLIRHYYWLTQRFFRRIITVTAGRSLFARNDGDDRGQLIPYLTVRENGDLQCNSCMVCQIHCPQQCIQVQNSHGNYSRPKVFEINFSRCIFCGDCVNVCPIDALRLEKKSLLSFGKAESLILGIAQLKNDNELATLSSKQFSDLMD